jgi:hypothetical protein
MQVGVVGSGRLGRGGVRSDEVEGLSLRLPVKMVEEYDRTILFFGLD